MRLLLLSDDEALFLEGINGGWSTEHAGDRGIEADAHRSNSVQVARKLKGRYSTREMDQIARVALQMIG